MRDIKIWTDGACSGNPGKGGWCAILTYGDAKKIISGGENETTNNKMELLAVISGLQALKEPCNVTLHSDSAYIVNAFHQDWISNWIANGWRSSKRQPVANKDLWLTLLELTKLHNVTFAKVKGHSDNYYNNVCDEIARKEINKLR